VVVAMLEYLRTKSQNPLYTEEVNVDAQAIDSLPIDGQAEGIVMIQSSDDPPSDSDVLETIQTPPLQQQKIEDPDCEYSDFEASLRANCTMTLQEPTNFTKDSKSEELSIKISSNRNRLSYSDAPLAIWDPTLILGAFPFLFLSSEGLPLLERPPAASSVTQKKKISPIGTPIFRFEIRSYICSDLESSMPLEHCFPFQNPSFVFFARSVLTFQLVKNELEDVTVGEFRTMLETQEGREQIERFVWKSIATVPGSQSYWTIRRKELWEIAKQVDHVNTFFTFSIADNHHPILLKMFGLQNNAPISEKIRVINSNPGAVDHFFEQMTMTITQTFFKKVLGFSWMWNRVEYQNRGTAHCHRVGDFAPFRVTDELIDLITGHIADSILITSKAPQNSPPDIVQR